MSEVGIPEKVRFLGADDFCRGELDGDGGTHCLRGWKLKEFGFDLVTGTSLARQATESIRSHSGANYITEFNDNPNNSKRKLAATWNKAMKSLGYTKREGKYLVRPSKKAGR